MDREYNQEEVIKYLNRINEALTSGEKKFKLSRSDAGNADPLSLEGLTNRIESLIPHIYATSFDRDLLAQEVKEAQTELMWAQRALDKK